MKWMNKYVIYNERIFFWLYVYLGCMWLFVVFLGIKKFLRFFFVFEFLVIEDEGWI